MMAKRPSGTVLDECSAQTRPLSGRRPKRQMLHDVHLDYRRHGSTLFNAAFLALLTYRLGRWSESRRRRWSRFLARKLYAAVHAPVATLTRIWIPPAVTLGEGFHIIHAEGSLSIHPDTVIGKRCGVMHNVTIGTNMTPGAPVIGDDVFIGVNATVLGPIRIGDRVRIAANTAVSSHVPSDCIVVGSPARVYPRLGPFRREPDRQDPARGRIHD
jgi:serine O-acetyltransferase